jgi:hypothetical protein
MNGASRKSRSRRFLIFVNQSPEISRPIYSILADDFDFLMALSVDHIEYFPFQHARNFNAGIYYSVRRTFSGTGSASVNLSQSHGSKGRLQGIAVLDTGGRGIFSGNATHELLHHWGDICQPTSDLAVGRIIWLQPVSGA